MNTFIYGWLIALGFFTVFVGSIALYSIYGGPGWSEHSYALKKSCIENGGTVIAIYGTNDFHCIKK